MPLHPRRLGVLAIGDELLLGRTLDTNSGWLADWGTRLGLTVDRLEVVGDRQTDIEAVLAAACARVDLLMVTGGLGPTEDDRTRHALAAVLAAPLLERASAWRAIRAHFHRFGHGEPHATNRRQALMPRGAKMLRNDRGTAPGLLARVDRAWVACLPGVPHEMMAMAERLAKDLPDILPGLKPPVVGEVYLAGIGESTAQARIPGLLSEENPQVGITASELGHLCLRVIGQRAQVVARVAELRRRLREHLLPEAGLAPSLVAELRRRREYVTAAESCTAGHVVAQLASVSGASAVLRESIVTYHPDAKRDRLGVAPRLIRQHGVVSAAVAEAMAEGVARLTGSELAVATTGVAGPTGGTRETPVGTVWMAVTYRGRTLSRRADLRGSRERIQRRAAAQVLALAWTVLMGRG